jgi:hypothetical protein
LNRLEIYRRALTEAVRSGDRELAKVLTRIVIREFMRESKLPDNRPRVVDLRRR